MILKCFVYDFEKLFNDFELFFNDFFKELSRRSKIFERDTYKGGRQPKAAPPLCRSLLSHIVQLVLTS